MCSQQESLFTSLIWSKRRFYFSPLVPLAHGGFVRCIGCWEISPFVWHKVLLTILNFKISFFKVWASWDHLFRQISVCLFALDEFTSVHSQLHLVQTNMGNKLRSFFTDLYDVCVNTFKSVHAFGSGDLLYSLDFLVKLTQLYYSWLLR